jgi:hypothetical protein
MRLPDRRTLLLAGGAAVALLLFGFVSLRDDSPAGPETTGARGTAARGGTSPGDVPVVDVHLELLKNKPTELAEGERNPFRFKPKPPPPPPPEAVVRVPDPTPTAPPVPSGPPPPPPIPLRFIGLVEAPSQGARVAILSDGRGNVFYGKEGDIIEGRYRVLKIGADAAELAYSDGRGRQTIRLSGQ